MFSFPTRILLESSRRRILRRAVRAECEVVSYPDFRLLGRSAVDLSPEGMLLESEFEPWVGEPVIVTVRAPGTRQWIDAEARVARVVSGRRRSDRVRGIGLHFGPLDAVSRAILGASLHGRPPPVPARAPGFDYARTVRGIAGL